MQQRGRGLQPLGFFRFPNLEVFHVAFLGSSQNISGFEFRYSEKKHFLKTDFFGAKSLGGYLWTSVPSLPKLVNISAHIASNLSHSGNSCGKVNRHVCKVNRINL